MGCLLCYTLHVILAQTNKGDKMKDEQEEKKSNVDCQDPHEGMVE